MNHRVKPTDLDIVLPCFNPKAGWDSRVVNSYHVIQSMLPDVQIGITLVNDGSVKPIAPLEIEYLQQNIPAFQLISYSKNRGKGFALRKGIAQCTAPICIYTDIDFPYTEKSFVAVYFQLKSTSANVVAGIRNTGYYDHVPYLRKLISKFLRWMIRGMLSISITDTQGGLKGFDEKGREVFLRTNIDRYLFDLQFIYLVSKNKLLHLIPLEVELKDDVVFSRMNPKILITEFFNFLKIVVSKKS